MEIHIAYISDDQIGTYFEAKGTAIPILISVKSKLKTKKIMQ
jgi:hypothetical protein